MHGDIPVYAACADEFVQDYAVVNAWMYPLVRPQSLARPQHIAHTHTHITHITDIGHS